MRKAEINRQTTETQISLKLNLDGSGKYQIKTGVGFLDHMLELFTRHGRFDLELQCKGDIHIDFHHTVEDVGIALGQAFGAALGEMRGVVRYGNYLLPMDEALVLVAIDLSGRSYLGYDVEIPTDKVGEFDCELVEEFFLGFTRAAGITLHFKQLAGQNSHHIIEAIYKGFGRALAAAVQINSTYAKEIPSTKGMLK